MIVPSGPAHIHNSPVTSSDFQTTVMLELTNDNLFHLFHGDTNEAVHLIIFHVVTASILMWPLKYEHNGMYCNV